MSVGDVVKYKQVKTIIMSENLQDEIQDLLFKLELAIKTKVEKGMDVADQRVTTQRSRFYKFWCFVIWGHLLNDKGLCLRCGKKVGVTTVKSK